MAFRQAIINGKSVVIAVKEMVIAGTSAFYRPTHVLDQVLVEQTLGRTEAALQKPGIVPPAVMEKLVKVELESLDHPSPLDPRMHSTGVMKDENGNQLGKIHIMTDPSLQGPARIDGDST